MRWIDVSILFFYTAAMLLIGTRAGRRQQSTEDYFVARRQIPAWAIGISIMATLVSSVTFIGYPGSAYGGNWSNLVPGFLLLVVLAMIGKVVVPFYREAVGMSAYEYFGARFGTPTRLYASLAFALGHFGKMGFVYYLVALTANSMTGWSIDLIIIAIGIVTIYYTMVGGIEAVIWTDVIQACIKLAGVVVCLGYLLFLPPGGPDAVFSLAAENGKFSLGDLDWDFTRKSIPVLVLYGFFWYLQKYTADQTIVQRYLIAKSDRAALRGATSGALQTIPVWALFMLIGTCTWAFYKLTGEALPGFITKADQVFPHFLSTHVPAGLAGLFLAALMSAGMSTLAGDLNCIAVVGVQDVYKRIRPDAPDGRCLKIGKGLVVLFGVLGVGMAEILAHSTGGALNLWFTVSAILSGGLAGLFVLAFLSDRAHRRGVYAGIAACLLFTAWATVTGGKEKLIHLGGWNYGWDELTIGAVANFVLWVIGLAASYIIPRAGNEPSDPPTYWRWRKSKIGEQQAAPAA